MTQPTDTTVPDPAPPNGHWREARALLIEGEMAADFLQGYLTCDTLKMQPGVAQPAALCNVKGRVLANGWAVVLPPGIALVIHASLIDDVRRFLTPYINFSKCTLSAAPLFVATNTETADVELLDEVRIELVHAEPAAMQDVSAQMNRRLVAAGIAFVSAPVSGEFLPQMLALDSIGAVDFSKGCYLGQEIVARAKFRGAVKRRLQPFTWQGEAPAVGSSNPERDTVINVADDGHGLQVTRVEASPAD